MKYPIASRRLARFGPFEVDLQAGQLRKNGLKVKLYDQPFQILVCLLEHAGEVVTREELQQKLWPADTFTDFDHGLNNAINRLREALCDSADKPRYVETLPRRGYRFIAPVDLGAGAQPSPGPANVGPSPSEGVKKSAGADLKVCEGAANSCRRTPQGVRQPSEVRFSDTFSGRGTGDEGVAASPVPTPAGLPQEPALSAAKGVPLQPAPGDAGAVRKLLRPGPWPLRLAATLAMLLVGIAVGWFVWQRAWRPSAQAATSRISSLAVLPLENLSRDPEQEYFADGMTDELITTLAKVSALRVISRTSAMQYKHTKKPLPQIGRELNVDAVLEGTVRRSGTRVRITIKLVQAAEDRHLWAETYERDLRDVLALQEEVAHDMASEIRVKLTPRERAGLSSARPVNPEAHEAYLRGIYLWNKRNEPDLEKSIEYFNQAAQKDPGYALSYAGLANAYNLLGSYAPREIHPKARAAALKALALDDSLGEAHAALGVYKAAYEWDDLGADREFRRAIELNPGYVWAHVWRGETLSGMERHREALAELDRACELDPTSLRVSDQRGWVLYMARRYDEAIEQFRKTLDLEPRYAHARCWLGKAYLQRGMLQEGLAELEKGASLPGGRGPLFRHWLGYGYARCGKRAEALKIIETMTAQGQKSFASPWGVAAIYCGLGQKEQALAWLERAYQDRDDAFPAANIEPAFDPLRSDTHFQDLMRRSRLPP
jgi:TolB-like protein/DNA-binding winged helix-turn-helix (wHTH) protein/Tfp pilus assembly protein PilF